MTPTTTTSNTPRIEWHDLIETRDMLPIGSEFTQRYTQAVANIVNSVEGQAVLAELQALQSLIPKENRWHIPITNEHKKNAETFERITALNAAYAMRHSQKLQINLHTNNQPPQPFSMTNGQNSGRYFANTHLIQLGFPYITSLPMVMRNPTTGESVLQPASLDEIMLHEMRHAVQHLRERFGKGTKQTYACQEAEAVETQRRYAAEMNSKSPKDQQRPLRDLYVDADFVLKYTLDKEFPSAPLIYRALRKLGVPHKYRAYPNPFTQEQIEGIASSYVGIVTMDAGCKILSDAELLQKTRQLLENNGVSNSSISDVRIQELMRKGTDKQNKNR